MVGFSFFEHSLFKVGLIYLVAIMSPGPSILAILRNSSYGREIAIWTAVGTLAGISLQALYVLIGLKFIHSYKYVVFLMQLLCGLYLIYIGLQTFINPYKEKALVVDNIIFFPCKKHALKQGFLIDALNPLALTFFLSIFSLYVPSESSLSFKFVSWLEIVIIGGIWFIGVAFLASNKIIQKALHGLLSKYINAMSAIIFIVFGIKLLAKLCISYNCNISNF